MQKKDLILLYINKYKYFSNFNKFLAHINKLFSLRQVKVRASNELCGNLSKTLFLLQGVNYYEI